MIYIFFQVATMMVGYSIHHSRLWSLFDGVFAPFVWLKWIICQEVNLTIIKHCFEFFFK